MFTLSKLARCTPDGQRYINDRTVYNAATVLLHHPEDAPPAQASKLS